LPAAALGLPDDGLLGTLRQLDERRREALRDVIQLAGGPFRHVSLLIFARFKMVSERLVRVRAFAAGGAQIEELSVEFEHITDDAQLPPNWVDRSGPWWDDVTLAQSYFPALGRQDGWGQFLVQIKLPRPALKVEIGVAPLEVTLAQFGMTPPAFFLAVVDALSEQEVTRQGADNQEAGDDRQGLEDALGNRPLAMLLPNAQYEVVVRYSGDVGKKREDPGPGEDANEIVPIRSEASQ
jgi:hypothetical protein